MLKIPTFVLGALLIITGLVGYLFQDPNLSINIVGPLADDAVFTLSDGNQTHTLDRGFASSNAAGEHAFWMVERLNQNHAKDRSQGNYAASERPDNPSYKTQSFWYASSTGDTLSALMKNSETGELGALETVDPEKAKVYKKTKLVGGEIIIVVRGEPGASAITDSKVKGFNLTRGTAIIAVDSNKIEPLYLLSFIRSQKAQNYIKLFTKGATLKQINLLDLRNMIVSVPPRKIQKQFLKINEDVIFIKKYQKQSGQNIEELKQNLMNNVFKGEIIC